MRDQNADFIADRPMTEQLKVSSFKDLENLPPETPEQAYRRGYCDGWVRAIDTLHDLMFRDRLNRQAAYDACWEFWEGALFEWQMGDCSQLVLPPEVERQPVSKKGEQHVSQNPHCGKPGP